MSKPMNELTLRCAMQRAERKFILIVTIFSRYCDYQHSDATMAMYTPCCSRQHTHPHTHTNKNTNIE